MQYEPLIETNSSLRGSFESLNLTDNAPSASASEQDDHTCSSCRSKLAKKQEVTHTPMECLSERCRLLENDVIRLKDRDIKSRLQIKELETKVTTLQDAIKGLVAPTQSQAAPYSFGPGHKLRNQLKKAQSFDTPPEKTEVNYDNIILSKQAGTKERVGLFGSLGAASQYRY